MEKRGGERKKETEGQKGEREEGGIKGGINTK